MFFQKSPATFFPAFLLLLLPLSTASAQSVRQATLPTITVSDLDRLLPFYTEVLQFKVVSIAEEQGPELAQLLGSDQGSVHLRMATLRLGDEQIRLLDFLGEDTGKPVPPDSRSNDLWFQHIAIVTGNMNVAYQRLRTYRVQHVSTAPQTLPEYLPAASGISAFYFRDPDGHNLEIISYPPGKGQPRWQQADGNLFLGIDHTAIAVSDTERSLTLYQTLLGLTVLGKSENYGPEQEHLNQVFGAHLDITGLGAPTPGIGVEFLQYLAPPGGRPFPADTESEDRWNWWTTLVVDRLDELQHRLQQQGYRQVSQAALPAGASTLFPDRSLLFRDADGHGLLLTEKRKSE